MRHNEARVHHGGWHEILSEEIIGCVGLGVKCKDFIYLLQVHLVFCFVLFLFCFLDSFNIVCYMLVLT